MSATSRHTPHGARRYGTVPAACGRSGRRLALSLPCVWVVFLTTIPQTQAAVRPALSPLVQQATQGQVAVQLKLMDDYHWGRNGLPKSPAKSVYWARKAAAQGNPRAETNLGFYHESGYGGLRKNPAKALYWCRKAAAQGYPRAESNLGFYHESGYGGLRKNPAKALYWYRKAAAQGYKPAVAALREMLRSQQMAVAHPAPKPRPAAVASPPDRQRVVQSLRSFWNLYFSASNAHVVDFGAPALVRPVGFGGAGS